MTIRERFKNKKFRQNSIVIGSAALAVIICAMSIPVGVYKDKKITETETTSGSSLVAELPVSESTTLPDETTTLEDNGETTTLSTVGAKDGVTEKQEPSSTKKTPTTTKKASVKTTTSSKTTKATTKAPAATKTKETTTQNIAPKWSKAQADKFVAESRAYGESIGLVWDESFDLTNACWQSCVYTLETVNGRSFDNRLKKMKEALDNTKGRKKAQSFKIWVENIDGEWEFTILWMKSNWVS